MFFIKIKYNIKFLGNDILYSIKNKLYVNNRLLRIYPGKEILHIYASKKFIAIEYEDYLRTRIYCYIDKNTFYDYDFCINNHGDLVYVNDNLLARYECIFVLKNNQLVRREVTDVIYFLSSKYRRKGAKLFYKKTRMNRLDCIHSGNIYYYNDMIMYKRKYGCKWNKIISPHKFVKKERINLVF